ncbi:MAG: hypothetical protein ACFE8V_12265 [Promethearchaeota archaeon]
MVIVLATTYFPADKSTEVGKKYLEVLKKFPTDRSIDKPILPVAVRTTSRGMKAISVTEVKDGKFKEYMKRFYQNILEYFDIEGYKVDFEVFMSGAEALPLVGLEMPEI